MRAPRLAKTAVQLGPVVLPAAALVLAIGFIDVYTGPEFGISLLYLFPVLIAAWFGGRLAGPLLAAIAAATWYATDVSTVPFYTNHWAPVWNSFTRLVYFTTAVVLVREYRAKQLLTETLALSERKFRSVFENAAVGVARVSPEGCWLEVNGHICEKLGYPRATLEGLSIGQLTHPEDREIIRREFAKLVSGVTDRFGADLRLLRQDGSMIWANVSGASVLDDRGRPLWLVVMVEDISMRKAAEESLHRLNLELERRVLDRTDELLHLNRELESFNYSVAHDLRTPLRGIDGFGYLLLDEYGDRFDDRGKQYLQRVRTAATKMGELIDALLTLSRLPRGGLDFERVDLSALAQEIAADLRDQHPSRNVVMEIAPDLVATGDPGMLRTALANLVDNAWKFTRDVTPAHITIGRQVIDGEEAFFVQDNGAGFESQYSDKLFKPFQRLHSPGEYEGQGIGLATVQRVVERHGGRIWAQGEVGKGATFLFTLDAPAAAHAVVAVEPAQPASSEVPVAGATEG